MKCISSLQNNFEEVLNVWKQWQACIDPVDAEQ